MRYAGYQTYYKGYRKVKSSNTMNPVFFDTDVVFAAAAYAQRINGGYLKSPEMAGNVVTTPSNRDLVKIALADTSVLTDSDRSLGQKVRQFLGHQLTVKTLRGSLTDFDQAVSKVINRDQIADVDRYDIAITASLISAYERAQREQALSERVDHTRGYLGDVGAKVLTNIEVTKSVYSQNYSIYFISGITDTNQSVFFSFRDSIAIGSNITIKGTVKAHRDGTTQLNRVRLV